MGEVGLIDAILLGDSAQEDLRRVKTVDPDFVPEGDGHCLVRLGDIWLLGAHRVACGSSTDRATVSALLNGDRPILMVTDPPYGVEYDPNWRNETNRANGKPYGSRAIGQVINDSQVDWRKAWALFPGNVAYVWHADRYASSVQVSIESSGFMVRCQIIWVKQRLVIGRGDYHWMHEPCWYCVREGQTGNWTGDRSQTTVWNIAHGKSDTGHGTQKPIECMRRPILNNSARGEMVYDPFLGSGTTLIACEMEGRICRAVELNPQYVGISIYRWQMMTGRLATLEATGETFTEVLRRRTEEPDRAEPEVERPRVGPAPITFAPRASLVALAADKLPAASAVAAALIARPAPAQAAAVVAGVRPLRVVPVAVSPKPIGPPPPDPFLTKNAAILASAGTDGLKFDESRWLDPAPASMIVFLDIEVFLNFFVVCLKRLDGRRAAFAMSDLSRLDVDGLRAALRGATVVTFNGASYDIPILMMAVRGDDTSALKNASNRIISGGMKSWQSEKEFNVRAPRGLDHIDLMELSFRSNLKVLHGRLHGRTLVDLPFDPDAYLSDRDMNVVTLYCMNDLDATETLYNSLIDRIALRESMGRAVGLDLRSKSDAQMGEAIVRRNIEKTQRIRIGRPDPKPMTFRYKIPEFVRFSGSDMKSIVEKLSAEEFRADAGGNIEPPPFLKNATVRIGDVSYAMGIGGLHSQEEHRSLKSDDSYQLVDVDVSSHYPRIILHLGLCPPAVGPVFLDVYRELMEGRLAAKKKQLEIEQEIAGLERQLTDEIRAQIAVLKIKRDHFKTIADGQKICANGVFGKLGSPYSFLYAPNILTAVTLTGQLSILMLIEEAEATGIRVASANTDGVLFHCPRDLLGALDELVASWEEATEFVTEKTNYRAIYSSSVNSYFAVKEDGKVKRKGPAADPWKDGDLRGQLAKNPQMTVCAEAVERLAVDGIPLTDTVLGSRDIRGFVTLIRVDGGATWRGRRLGRAVRYYWSTDGDPISYVNANRKVAKTDGARPMMELLDALPEDVDYDRYIAEATKMAREYAVITTDGEGLIK